MNLSQKAKYFICGVLGSAILIPLTIKAIDSVPLTFSAGDVISADVMNTILARLNDTQRGYQSATELAGTYSCTTYDNNGANSCPTGNYVLTNGIFSVTQSVTMTASGQSLTVTPATDSLIGCGGNTLNIKTVTLTLVGGLVSNSATQGWQAIHKLSPTDFRWESDMPYSFTRCSLVSTPPPPADGLAATVNGTSVSLTWTEQSTNVTGFKVQRSTSAASSWTDLQTTAVTVMTYTDSGLTAGTYSYRVIATNNFGDSMSSSVVQATIQ